MEIPETFVGLSYESSQLAHPGFFSPYNRRLINLFKTLGPSGVLRIGGNTSEYSTFNDSSSPVDAGDSFAEGPDTNSNGARPFKIEPLAIANLSAFLRATGWKLIYGLNLAGGTTANAVAECSCVTDTCGDAVIAFQLGNEPEMFKHGPEAKDRWTYEEYISRWKILAAALKKNVSDVKLAGPDIAFRTEWVGRFAEDMKANVAFASAHFYPEGPPSDPSATITYLLGDKTKFNAQLAGASALAKANQLAFRMTEGNSCYNGGKKGVSDTFASSLWAADLLLRAASVGCSGLNMHGGGNGLYTPIAGESAAKLKARPEYYGLLLASSARGADLLQCSLSDKSLPVSCYAIRKMGQYSFYGFNTSTNPIDVVIEMSGEPATRQATVRRLLAPSVDATSGITYGGSEISETGLWRPKVSEVLRRTGARYSLDLPAFSAARVEFA